MRILGSAFAASLALALSAGLIACVPAAPAPATATVAAQKATAEQAKPTSAPAPTVAGEVSTPAKAAATAAVPAPTTKPAAAVPAKLENVKLAVVTKGGGFYNFYFTKDKGIYAAEGLDAEIVTMQPALMVPALSSGQIDYSASTTTILWPGVKGLPMKAVMAVNGKPTWYIVGGPDINSASQLKGKTVGVTGLAAQTAYGARVGIKAQGLDPDKDVTLVPVERADRAAALKTKAIAGALLATPEHFQAEQEFGFKVLIDIGRLLDFPLAGLGTSDKIISENPEQVKKMIRGTLKGMAYMKANPQETIQYIEKEMKWVPDVSKVLYDDSLRTFVLDGSFSDKSKEAMVEAGLESGDLPANLKGKVQLEKGLNETLLKQVLETYKP